MFPEGCAVLRHGHGIMLFDGSLGMMPFGGLNCYESLTWDNNRQSWHDKAATTYVIET